MQCLKVNTSNLKIVNGLVEGEGGTLGVCLYLSHNLHVGNS